MSEMIERMARVLCRAERIPEDGLLNRDGRVWENGWECRAERARDALLAALDPTDAVLVYVSADALRRAEEAQEGGGLSNREDAARVMIEAIRGDSLS